MQLWKLQWRQIMLSLLLALFGGLSGPSFDELPVKAVETYAQQAVENLQPGFGQKIHVVTVTRSEMTPLGSVNSPSRQCIIVINNNASAWRMWGRFTQYVAKEDWPALIEASVAHEIGHCEERALNVKYTGLDKHTADSGLMLTSNRNAAGGFGKGSSMSTQLASELYADVYAHLYLRKYLADKADKIEDAWQKGRDEYASADPDHATSPYLTKISRFENALTPETSMAEAAWTLRTQTVRAFEGANL